MEFNSVALQTEKTKGRVVGRIKGNGQRDA
jgi:hypothetical protein